MPTLLLVAPPGEAAALPTALTMLPHTIEPVDATSPRLAQAESAIVLVDARRDLTWARQACQDVRAATDRPLLLLLQPSALAVVQRGWGHDDFVLAEAEPAEFEARLRCLLAAEGRSSTIKGGAIVIDEDAYTVTVGGQPLDLTYTEFELLKYLALHPGRVLTREHLLSEVWGYDYYGGTRTVDVHIRRLRAKLGPEHEAHVATVRNVGYRFQATR